jgi:hypothetical protein
MDVLRISPAIKLEVVAAAILDQVIKGFEKDPLETADLQRIGTKVLQTTAGKA